MLATISIIVLTREVYLLWRAVMRRGARALRRFALSVVRFARTEVERYVRYTIALYIKDQQRKFSETFYHHTNFKKIEILVSFLWHQIRCIVAILILIGQGKEEISLVKSLLDIEKYPCTPNYQIASGKIRYI